MQTPLRIPTDQLPPIPGKRYFSIGEAAELCDVKPHVLRYWEQEFPQLRPVKRRGNRRYYQHHEVQMIRRIREMLYEQGFTISGARGRLSESTLAESPPAATTPVRIPVPAQAPAAVSVPEPIKTQLPADASAPARSQRAETVHVKKTVPDGATSLAATLNAEQARWLAAELRAIRSLIFLQ